MRKFLFSFLILIVAVVVLEFSLRLSDSIFEWTRPRVKALSFKDQNEIRILTIGGSITALGNKDSYPKVLEKLLKERIPDKRFVVINVAKPGKASSVLLDALPNQIKHFKPNIAVIMMGISDRWDVPEGESFWRNLEVIKFLFKVKKRFLGGIQTFPVAWARSPREPDEADLKKVLEEKPKDSVAHSDMALWYEAHNDFNRAVPHLKKSIKYSDKPGLNTVLRLAYAYLRIGKPGLADKVLWDESIRFPTMEYYGAIMHFYFNEKNSINPLSDSDARRIRKYAEEAIKLDSDSPVPYSALATLYLEITKEKERGVSNLKKAVELGSSSSKDYQALGSHYEEVKDWSNAESVLKIGISKHPKDFHLWIGLVRVYLGKKDKDASKDALKKLRELAPHNPIVLSLHQEYKKLFGEQVFKSPPAMQKSRDYLKNPVLRDNYVKMVRLLHQNNVLVVAMQYPRYELAPLQDVLSSEKGVVFVSSKKEFDVAIKEKGYHGLFKDRIDNDHGHFTKLASQIVAERVFEEIKKQIQ